MKVTTTAAGQGERIMRLGIGTERVWEDCWELGIMAMAGAFSFVTVKIVMVMIAAVLL